MKVFCVGRNYAEHAKELQNEVPENPVIFMKPPTAVITNEQPLEYPSFTQELHYEGEIVLRIGKKGKNIPINSALSHVDALTVGIDFTARDIQNELKKKGLPWEIAKGFDGSAPIGTFKPFNHQKRFQLFKNDLLVQDGNMDNMIFQIPVLIHFISTYFTLEEGDLIFTGTPKGVGSVQKGDVLEGLLEGEKVLFCQVE
jgi:acylpyruvate hydrolase